MIFKLLKVQLSEIMKAHKGTPIKIITPDGLNLGINKVR